MTALARERESVAGFINSSEVVGAATAERREDLEAGFAKLPGFLRELRSTMGELRSFSDAATPVFSRPRRGGALADPAQPRDHPVLERRHDGDHSLGNSAEALGPAAGRLRPRDPPDPRASPTTASRRARTWRSCSRACARREGFEYLMKTIFGLSGTVNSFDQYGHFLRALIPTQQLLRLPVDPPVGLQRQVRRRDPALASREGAARSAAAQAAAGDDQTRATRATGCARRRSDQAARPSAAPSRRPTERSQARDVGPADEPPAPGAERSVHGGRARGRASRRARLAPLPGRRPRPTEEGKR